MTDEVKQKFKELRKLKVDLWTKATRFNEIGQTTGIHYAFLSPKSDGYRQCHGWIKCRDFLNDALRSHITGKSESIYGFSYKKGENPPLDTRRMRLLIKQNSVSNKEPLREVLDRSVRVLNCLEKHCGIKPLTKLYQTSDNKDIYVLVGSGDWMESTFMISLYTFLIRLGAKNVKSDSKEELDTSLLALTKISAYDHDINYLKTALPYLYRILENRKELRYNKKEGKRLFDDQNISMFHSYTGIVALCNQAKSPNPRTGNYQKLEDLIALSDFIRNKKEDTEVPKEIKQFNGGV